MPPWIAFRVVTFGVVAFKELPTECPRTAALDDVADTADAVVGAPSQPNPNGWFGAVSGVAPVLNVFS